ncbi:hypothetical protein BH11PSE4_BH11PSE4_22890 [soil metagenome]
MLASKAQNGFVAPMNCFVAVLWGSGAPGLAKICQAGRGRALVALLVDGGVRPPGQQPVLQRRQQPFGGQRDDGDHDHRGKYAV